MGYFEVALIALGLAADAFAVSVSVALSAKNTDLRDAFKAGFFCGIFQAAMLLLGWLLGGLVAQQIESIAHWLAFTILLGLGIKMLLPAKDGTKSHTDFSLKSLLMLAFATSIDAAATGISFVALDVSIWVSCTIVGGVAFLLSFLGVLLARKLSGALKNHATLIGGIILIFIAFEILLTSL